MSIGLAYSLICYCSIGSTVVLVIRCYRFQWLWSKWLLSILICNGLIELLFIIMPPIDFGMWCGAIVCGCDLYDPLCFISNVQVLEVFLWVSNGLWLLVEIFYCYWWCWIELVVNWWCWIELVVNDCHWSCGGGLWYWLFLFGLGVEDCLAWLAWVGGFSCEWID